MGGPKGGKKLFLLAEFVYKDPWIQWQFMIFFYLSSLGIGR